MPNPDEYRRQELPEWVKETIPDPTKDDMEEVKRRLDEIFEPVPTTQP